MPIRLPRLLLAAGYAAAHGLRQRLLAATRPSAAPLAVGTLADLVRSKPALVAENALLRHQLGGLHRNVKRPRCTPTDRTLLRWHRQLFRRYWRRRSPRATAPAHRPPLALEMVALIQEMAAANRLWGAERTRGELLKLDIHGAKSTIQKYLRDAGPPRKTGQAWATFLRHHAAEIWARDLLPVTGLRFRPLFACFIIALAARRVVHVGVTRHPPNAWVAQQLREATPFDARPRSLIRDNDSKYGQAFARVADATGITELRTAPRTLRLPAAARPAAAGSWQVNHKRVYRLSRLEGLSLRLKSRKKRVSGLRGPKPVAARPNECWSMDFMADRLVDGRRFRVLTFVDNVSRVSPAIVADGRRTGERVVEVLAGLMAAGQQPQMGSIDNGPESSRGC